jgi:hypothetical protein
MKSIRIAALLAALPPLAAAEVADPAAAVPQPRYRSALPVPGGVAELDIPWKQANEAVARFPRGHADLLKWEEGRQSGPAAPASAPVPERRQP